MLIAAIEGNTGMTYQIVRSECRTHGAEGACVYGIRIINLEDENDFAEIEDISPELSNVEELKNILEDEGVTPDQLRYIVEDYLEKTFSYKY